MKNFQHTPLFSVLLSAGLAASAWAGSMPEMQVKVTQAGGKVVYEGTTDSSGGFHTRPLAPGNYVVQFNAKSAPKGGPLSLVLDDTGKGPSVANGVSASKFARGGIAMKVEVGPKTMSLTGHLSHGAAASTSVAAGPASTPVPKNGIHMEEGKKVKYENGTKFIWVEGISAMGGHWALATSPEAKNAQVVGKQAPAGDHESDR